MSASYIHRDRFALHQPDSILKLPLGVLDATPQEGYVPLSAPGPHHDRLCDQLTVSGKLPSSSPTQSQVSLRSPKMSPDSTLTHISASHFLRNSPPRSCFGGGGSSSASSSTCESSLRTALLSDRNDRSCVSRSTVPNGAQHLSTTDPLRVEPILPECKLSPTGGPGAATSSHMASSTTDAQSSTAPYFSTAPLPSSTTTNKKSSRRNPWGPETYSDLITVAIHSYPDHQATLQQIYDFIITHYDYFRDRSDPATSAGWKNSIRHNLSLHDRFAKCPKSSDNTKSSYWRINTEVACKPYVRRRACSMDGGAAGGSVKRSSGCGKSGRASGACGSLRHQSSRHHEKSFGRTGGGGGLHALPELPPETYSSQATCDLVSSMNGVSDGDGRLFHRDADHDSQSDPSIHQKLSAYFGYGSIGSMDTTSTEITGSCNGTLWPPLSKPLMSAAASMVRPNYPNSVNPIRSYPYEQLSASPVGGDGSSAFAVSEFHPTVASTDQGLARSRANSLIEHLLRADIPSMNLTAPGERHTNPTHLSQSYLPNAFFTHQPLLSNSNRLAQAEMSAFLSPPAHPIDIRHQTAVSRAAVTSEPGTDGHLRTLYLQTLPANLSPESTPPTPFGAPWPNYAAQFAFSNPVSPYSPYLPESQPFSSFRSTEPKSCYDRSGDRVPLPFMTGCPLGPPSPSTNSSTSSSTRSWRPTLGPDPSATQLACGDVPNPRSTQHHLPTVTAAPNRLGRTGAFQPCVHAPATSSSPPPLTAASLYYASELFTPAEACALDTPPYLHVKPEPLDTDMPTDAGAESHGATGLPFTQQFSDSSLDAGLGNPVGSILYEHHHQHQQQQQQQHMDPASGLLLAAAQYNTHDYGATFADDVDRDKMELELSLELAERIVACTRSGDAK